MPSVTIESTGGNDEMSMENWSTSADIINGIIHVSRNTSNNSSAQGSTISSRRAQIPQNRPHNSTGINPTRSSRSRVQYEHLVNIIRNNNSGSTVFRLITGKRRAIPSTIYSINRNINLDHQFHMDATPTDIDNHSDTHSFGQNHFPVRWNGTICSVLPFIS